MARSTKDRGRRCRAGQRHGHAIGRPARPVAAAPPSGPAAAVMAALMAAPVATAAQLAQAVGLNRAAAGRELAGWPETGARPRLPG